MERWGSTVHWFVWWKRFSLRRVTRRVRVKRSDDRIIGQRSGRASVTRVLVSRNCAPRVPTNYEKSRECDSRPLCSAYSCIRVHYRILRCLYYGDFFSRLCHSSSAHLRADRICTWIKGSSRVAEL